MQTLVATMKRRSILLLSRDAVVIAQYAKLAEQLGAPLSVPPNGTAVSEEASLLVDANTWPSGPAQRDRLVRQLCRHAANAPTACFGQMLNYGQRAALDKAGVVTARGPGRTLFRILAFWEELERHDAVPEPERE